MAQTVNVNFKLDADVNYLENKYAAYQANKLNVEEHELIEE